MYTEEATMIKENLTLMKFCSLLIYHFRAGLAILLLFQQVYQVKEPIDQSILRFTWNGSRDNLHVEGF